MTESNNQPYSAVLDDIEAALLKLEQRLSKKVESVQSLRSNIHSCVERIDNLISVLEEDAK